MWLTFDYLQLLSIRFTFNSNILWIEAGLNATEIICKALKDLVRSAIRENIFVQLF